jgi:hypothetical protein
MKKITAEDTKRPQKAQETMGAFCGTFCVLCDKSFCDKS